MPKAKQPVSIAGVEFDALIKSEITYEADVPQYPIETGFTISDSVIVKQTKIEMTLYLSDNPVTWRRRLGGYGHAAQAIKHLENVFKERRLIFVSTSEANYSNMAIQSYSVSKSVEEGYSYEIPVSLVQVNVTQAGTTTIPDSYGKSGGTGVSAGPAEVVEAEPNDGTVGNTEGRKKDLILGVIQPGLDVLGNTFGIGNIGSSGVNWLANSVGGLIG